MRCDAVLPGAISPYVPCNRTATHEIAVDELGAYVYLCAAHAVIADAGGVVRVVGLGGIVVEA